MGEGNYGVVFEGFYVQGEGLYVQGEGSYVQGQGLYVQGEGFYVQGEGFKARLRMLMRRGLLHVREGEAMQCVVEWGIRSGRNTWFCSHS